MTETKLLPEEALIRTGKVDHADWNHRPILGSIERSRFGLCRRLLGNCRFGSLLEIGYGSGVFLPELARHADRICGIDVHPYNAEVAALLARHEVSANLYACGAEEMPFDSESFDVAVAVSSLEFIPDLPRAAIEIKRVLKPHGVLIAIMPGSSPLLDLGLRILTGESAKRDFGNRRELVVPTLTKYFRMARRLAIPRGISVVLPLYVGLCFFP